MTTHHPSGQRTRGGAHAYPGPAVEPPPPVYGAVTPYDRPLPPHGGYLVAHPDRLESGRSPVPKVWPVAVFTLLFSVLGAVSAGRRAARARAAGGSVAPYWLTFGIVAVIGFLLSAVLVAVAVPAYLAMREDAVVTALQSNLVTDGRLAATTKIKATAARCAAEGERGADGRRPYACVLKLTDGRTGTLHVTADSAGAWALAPTPSTTRP